MRPETKAANRTRAGLRLAGAGLLLGLVTASVTVLQTDVAVAVTPVTITTTTLPNDTINNPYNQQVMVSGGVSPYTFSVTSGSLPPGLVLATGTGVISGTPTATGPYTFTVTATDSVGATASQNYTVTVEPAVTITTTTLPDDTINIPYNQQVMASGGVSPYTFSVTSGSLAGFALATGTGVISGTPTATGSFTFTVTATDSVGATASQNYTVTVEPAVVITTTTLPDDTINIPYNQQVMASGGVSPYTFSVTSGSLPPGLVLATGTGVISGTPTATGPYTFTVTATDSVGATASQNYTVTVEPAVVITTTTLPDDTINIPYNQQVMANGGVGSYAFDVTSGSLPTGLALATGTGVISGTPTATGPYTFTVTATDSVGATASQNYTVTVEPAVVITTTVLPNPTVSTYYSQQIMVSGGVSPYTFSVSGSLPAGLALNTTGMLAGTPTVTGPYTFTVTATDIWGAASSQNYTITVEPIVTVTFNSEGGSAVSAINAPEDSSITLPGAPIRSGYGFLGWFTAPTGGSALSSPYLVPGNVTLDAQWVLQTPEKTTGLSSLSATSLVYGAESPETFTATFTGKSGDGFPEGTMTMYDSSHLLCDGTLSMPSADSAMAVCTLGQTELPTATYCDVFATFTPAAASSSDIAYAYTTSNSPQAGCFTVTKDTTTTTVSESPNPVARGGSAVTFTVSVTTHYAEAVPNGEHAVVRVDGATCTVTLSADTGTCTIASSAFTVGTFAVTDSYSGDTNLAGSPGTSSSPLTVTPPP